ncbi:MAG TPA: ABC transporter permease [Longimicrobiales bacterium]|nr:ABC transporter permease [Longimicrobiales bacterium]
MVAKQSSSSAPPPEGFIVRNVDGWVFGTARGVQRYAVLGGRALRFMFARPFYARDAVIQMDKIGFGSLPIVTLTGLFTGMVLALQSSVELSRFGADIFIGNLVGASMIRELGPVLASLMVASRAGSGIAAEIGSMRVTEQIDALRSFGTDPIKKLVTPRLLAALVVMPMLAVVCDAFGIFGGMLVAVFSLGVPPDAYLRGVWGTLAESGFMLFIVPRDFVGGLLKPFVFGGIIALTGCYYGLYTTGGTEGVGRSTTQAVVTASVLILAVDYFLTQALLAVLPPLG